MWWKKKEARVKSWHRRLDLYEMKGGVKIRWVKHLKQEDACIYPSDRATYFQSSLQPRVSVDVH